MNFQRHKVFIAQHPETELTVQVYRVDSFVEEYTTYRNEPTFKFLSTFYETETNQKVFLMKDRPEICLIITSKMAYHMRVL